MTPPTFAETYSLLAHARVLLGDLVIEHLNRDLDIQHMDEHPAPLSASSVPGFLYQRSSVARLDGRTLGRARVFWAGSNEIWEEIGNQRMRTALRSHGFSVMPISYVPPAGCLIRGILARWRLGSLWIEEILFLHAISDMLCPRSDPGSALWSRLDRVVTRGRAAAASSTRRGYGQCCRAHRSGLPRIPDAKGQ